jgi:hypothetical protein
LSIDFHASDEETGCVEQWCSSARLKVRSGQTADIGDGSAPYLDLLWIIGIELHDADANVVALSALFGEELINATDDISD